MQTEYVHSDANALNVAYFIYPECDAQDRKWMKFAERLKPYFTIWQVSPHQILQEGALEKCNVLFIGGGYPSLHSEALGAAGIDMVRNWLRGRQDRGIVGCCAGGYCCMRDNALIRDFNPHAWQLLPDVDVVLDNVGLQPFDWQFGQGDCRVELTEEGRQILGHEFSVCTTMYRNGPWMTILPVDVHNSHSNDDDDDDYNFSPSVALGHFTHAVSNSKDRTNDSMVGSIAALTGHMHNNRKNGRIVLWSSHPEFSSFSLVPLLVRCFKHAAGLPTDV